MPSSISSSERVLPAVPWLGLLAVAGLIFLASALGLEYGLAALGYEATARDSDHRWLAERARAAWLGERALILVGASRFQLGLDLDVLRQETGLEPIQLAIDGSGGDPILAGLARDASIRGTILVDYYDHAVGDRGGASERMQQLYEQSGGDIDWWNRPAATIENALTEWLRERLRAYADGATPLTSVRLRIIPQAPPLRYLITRPDRSRLADYTRVRMPEFYLRRVARTLGEEVDAGSVDIGAELTRRVASLSAKDNADFLREAAGIRTTIEAIRARGGRVIYVRMPSGALVREIENRRYPRELFWDPFLQESGAEGIDAGREGALQDFACPDGSHLDMRDRARFTEALVGVLKSRGLVVSVAGHQ